MYSFTVGGLGPTRSRPTATGRLTRRTTRSARRTRRFNYRITDGDGDTDEATQPITVTDGDDPTGGGQLALALEESDLDTAATGDDDSGDLAPATTTGSTP